jgi:hypothetical protein
MFKQITSKVTVILLVLGVMSNTFTSSASPLVEASKVSAKSNQTNKHNLSLPASKDAEDIVVDDLVMFNFSSNATCSVTSIAKKQAGESVAITVGNPAPWRAKIQVGSTFAEIALSYDVQTDHLTFNKSFSGNVTYTIDPNGEFIRFYINGSPFFSFENMKTCGGEMCASLNFSMNRTVLSLYACSSGGGSSALVARTNGQLQQSNAQKSVDDATAVTGQTPKAAFVSTHQSAPNPFTDNATIRYNLTVDAHVRLTIYNSLGQQISVLVNQSQTKGNNTVDWSTTADIKSGLYFYEILANNERMVGKLVKQ